MDVPVRIEEASYFRTRCKQRWEWVHGSKPVALVRWQAGKAVNASRFPCASPSAKAEGSADSIVIVCRYFITNPAYPEMNEHGIFFYPCAIMINHVQFSPLECANSRQDKKLLDTPLPSIEQAFSNLKDQVSHGIACGTKDMKIVVKLVYHRGDVNKTVEFFQITLLFFESNVELGFLNIFEL